MRGERLSQLVTKISPLREALPGTPVKKRRTPRKAEPAPTVGTSYACLCGQRFEDIHEAWRHIRSGCAHGRRTLAQLCQSVAEAYLRRDWRDAGGWPQHVESEFGDLLRQRLTRTERRELTANLRASGMSIPAIAMALGASVGTIHRDLAVLAPDASRDKILGLDGKRHPAHRARVAESLGRAS